MLNMCLWTLSAIFYQCVKCDIQLQADAFQEEYFDYCRFLNYGLSMVKPRRKCLPQSPDKTKPTMRDVAKQAGVSLAAVSYYFSGQRSFPEETKQRIDQAVSELDYSIRQPGRPRLTEKPSIEAPKTIGLFLPEKWDVFTKSHVNRLAWKGIRKVCTHRKIKLIVETITDEQSLVYAIENNQFEGIIFCGDPEVSVFKKYLTNIPSVHLLGEPDEHAWWDHITFDNSKIGENAANYFIKNNHMVCACYDPAEPLVDPKPEQILKATSNTGINAKRVEQFIETMEANGGKVYLASQKRSANGKIKTSTPVLLKKILQMKPEPTGLYMPTDHGSNRVHKALKKLGVDWQPGSWLLTNTWSELSFNCSWHPLWIDIRPEILGPQAVHTLIEKIAQPTPYDVLITLDPYVPDFSLEKSG